MISARLFILSAAVLLVSCSGMPLLDSGSSKETGAVARSEKLYQSAVWTERLRSVDELSEYRGNGALRFFIRAASDPHERIRIAAVRSLAQIRNNASYEALLNIAKTDENQNVRWEVLKALSPFKRKESAEIFSTYLNDSDWLVREASVSGYLVIDDSKVKSEAADIAVTALNDPNESVRIAALNGYSGTDPRVYAFASKQIAGGAYYRRTGYLKVLLETISRYKLDSQMRTAILQYITHPNGEVRVLALQAVKKSDEREK